ncbi:hypothetical protein C8R46DRAFT_1226481 [Mycena filopes]|nr:hypothetical protein C8R46DRAFT_1226481 [Mycena filopes]
MSMRSVEIQGPHSHSTSFPQAGSKYASARTQEGWVRLGTGRAFLDAPITQIGIMRLPVMKKTPPTRPPTSFWGKPDVRRSSWRFSYSSAHGFKTVPADSPDGGARSSLERIKFSAIVALGGLANKLSPGLCPRSDDIGDRQTVGCAPMRLATPVWISASPTYVLLEGVDLAALTFTSSDLDSPQASPMNRLPGLRHAI